MRSGRQVLKYERIVHPHTLPYIMPHLCGMSEWKARFQMHERKESEEVTGMLLYFASLQGECDFEEQMELILYHVCTTSDGQASGGTTTQYKFLKCHI